MGRRAREEGGSGKPGQESGPVEYNGKRYLVLRNVRGVLAVYRVRTSGALKRLVRWPLALESA